MTERLGDAPVEREFVDKMTAVMRTVDHFFNGEDVPKKIGIILMVFPFESDGRCNYMSNANRDDVVIMLKEQIKRFEGQPDVKGRA
jgi:hypothetical protein